MTIHTQLKNILQHAISKCQHAGHLPQELPINAIELNAPKQVSHGDISCNIAMVFAKQAKMPPRKLADCIVSTIEPGTLIDHIEIAGPGFINFFINPQAYLAILHDIHDQQEHYGQGVLSKDKKVQIEFVSANPTGPLHIGHGRGAVYGDTLASLLTFAGYDVSKEYYVNDAGNQMTTLGKSVYLRVLEQLGTSIDFPEDCYQGNYITDLAKEIMAIHTESFNELNKESAIALCLDFASKAILQQIKDDLAKLGITHDVYYHEKSLHADSAIDAALLQVKRDGHVYEKDGALWFNTTAFGDDKDRVLRKANGDLTYFSADIAYHKTKYDRGFDRVIDIWGADHAGYVKRMEACVQALGKDKSQLNTVLIQLVNLIQDGKPVSMSTRSATYETLADVRNEVGKDVCRYFFLMRSHHAQLDFDLDLAKQQTSDNPVFYIQYAYARICSIFKKAKEENHIYDSCNIDMELLTLPEEITLAKTCGAFPSIITKAANDMEPHRIAFYLLELTRLFQSYYSQGRRNSCYKVIGNNKKITDSKLYLLKNIQVVIKNGLGILGLSTPEYMTREEE